MSSAPFQDQAKHFRHAYDQVYAGNQQGHRRQRRHRPWHLDLPVRRRACAARRRAGAGQDAAGAHAQPGARPEFQPHPVHAGPDAVGHHRHQHHQRNRRRASASSRFQPGPLFAQIVLADEINRATPKTQSALLEAMQEHSVTVGGTIHKLEEPFFVMATQNPIEQEGTYPLPEAQLDRFFFKLVVNYSTRAGNVRRSSTAPRAASFRQPGKVMDGDGNPPMASAGARGAGRPGRAGLRDPPGAGDASAGRIRRRADQSLHPLRRQPARAQALVLAGKVRALLEGRFNVSFEDIRRVYLPALRHRILLNFEAQAENIAADTVLTEILKEVKEVAPSS